MELIYKPIKNITKEKLLQELNEIYIKEKQKPLEYYFLDFKSLPISLITAAIRFSLTKEDITNPVMILNILNLIKIFNTLDDSFFENKEVFVNNIEELLDIKLDLQLELQEFVKQLSIYFLSLFKTYNKCSYTPLDTIIILPNIYRIIIQSSDLLTLSGIFSTAKNINTNELMFIQNSYKYIQALLLKNNISINLMENFLGQIKNVNASK